jgi:hypothetical protein
MSASANMKITIVDREYGLRERLRGRLEQAGALRCAAHGKGVAAVTIHERENGWFDVRWTTCCDALRAEAAAIVKERC